MMLRAPLLFLLCLPLLLSACAKEEAAAPGGGEWIIRRIGIAAGTMLMPPEQLELRNRFAVSDRQLVAVVEVVPGSAQRTVRAQWYMPDASAPMLGEATVDLPQGGTQARLSFANPKDWLPSPYLLTVQVTEGTSSHPLSSASFPFFIGMTDEEVQGYWDAQNNAQWRAMEEGERLPPQGEKEEGLLAAAARELSVEAPLLAFREDLTGDGGRELVFLDTTDQPPFSQSRNPGNVLRATARRFVILDEKGAVLLRCMEENGKRILRNAAGKIGLPLPMEVGVSLAITPSFRLTVSWGDAGNACATTLLTQEEGFRKEASIQCSSPPQNALAG